MFGFPSSESPLQGLHFQVLDVSCFWRCTFDFSVVFMQQLFSKMSLSSLFILSGATGEGRVSWTEFFLVSRRGKR